jgi:hypothetical protein
MGAALTYARHQALFTLWSELPAKMLSTPRISTGALPIRNHG